MKPKFSKKFGNKNAKNTKKSKPALEMYYVMKYAQNFGKSILYPPPGFSTCAFMVVFQVFQICLTFEEKTNPNMFNVISRNVFSSNETNLNCFSSTHLKKEIRQKYQFKCHENSFVIFRLFFSFRMIFTIVNNRK